MAKDCNIKPRLPIQDDFRKLEETTVKAVLDYDSVIQNLIVNLRAKELLNSVTQRYLIAEKNNALKYLADFNEEKLWEAYQDVLSSDTGFSDNWKGID